MVLGDVCVMTINVILVCDRFNQGDWGTGRRTLFLPDACGVLR